MASKTSIAWCDSTFNPWLGCTRVSPGCDSCYAAVSRPALAMKIKWGAGEPRHRTSASNWKEPLKWNRRQQEKVDEWNMGGRDIYPPKPHLVFCASLADVFDNEIPEAWRDDLWSLIFETQYLTWLLLTKRIGNAAKMMATDRWPLPPRNVWLGASIVNQDEADRDIPKLLRTPAALHFISYEPALGPIDFTNIPRDDPEHPHPHEYDLADIGWIIVGGESAQGGAKARPFNIEWARSTVAQCKAAGVACFVKQLGSVPFTREVRDDGGGCLSIFPADRYALKDRAGADPEEWPVDIRVQEFPA
jgi:protein gp37